MYSDPIHKCDVMLSVIMGILYYVRGSANNVPVNGSDIDLNTLKVILDEVKCLHLRVKRLHVQGTNGNAPDNTRLCARPYAFVPTIVIVRSANSVIPKKREEFH